VPRLKFIRIKKICATIVCAVIDRQVLSPQCSREIKIQNATKQRINDALISIERERRAHELTVRKVPQLRTPYERETDERREMGDEQSDITHSKPNTAATLKSQQG
jgi:hypothetical protein